MSQTVYNSIGKPDTVIDEFGNATVYEYDEIGNLVETRTYDSLNNLLSVSQTLYDAEGQTLVSVGPFDPDSTAEPVGTETVYDELGRTVETSRWANNISIR